MALDYNNLVNDTKALLVEVCGLTDECAEILVDTPPPQKNAS